MINLIKTYKANMNTGKVTHLVNQYQFEGKQNISNTSICGQSAPDHTGSSRTTQSWFDQNITTEITCKKCLKELAKRN